MSGFGGPIIGADGFIGTTLLTGRGAAAPAAGATSGFATAATIAFGALTGAAGFAATVGFAAAGRSCTTLATGLGAGFAGFVTALAAGFFGATTFTAGFEPARAGFATGFVGFDGRFAGFATGFFADAFVGATFFKGFAAAARADGFVTFLVGALAGLFPAVLEFFFVTIFVAKVFSFGRSAAHLTLRRTDAAGCPRNTGPRQWVRGTA